MSNKHPVAQSEVDIFIRMQNDPRYFIQMMWGLTPQTKGGAFVKELHYTWQQNEILTAIYNSINSPAKYPPRISISAGRGIGKSTVLSWLVLWQLYCFKNAQVACTAPTASQLNDVLWKEIKLWLDKMPQMVQSKFEWLSDRVVVTENPGAWFARAATARKERPEALSGVHGEHVLLIADEASAVADEVYEMAKGVMTSGNAIFIMVSNPTRLSGHFYRSHHEEKEKYQVLEFSSLESPIVDPKFKEEFEQYGIDSNQFRVNVLGKFPKSDAVDDGGYIRLFDDNMLTFADAYNFRGNCMMGVDVAGEGEDYSVWVIRDNFCAQIVAREATSTPMSVAEKTVTLMHKYNIPASKVVFDSFGVGSDAVQELALSGHKVKGLLVGNKSEDDTYLNIRAENYWKLYSWIKKGGRLITHDGWKDFEKIKYRQEMSGKMKIKSKKEMRKDGIKSPDNVDALMLTFSIKNSEFKQKTNFGGVKPLIPGTNI